MPRFEERPYQTKAIADLRATAMDPVILYAPTGAGKTAVMCRVTSLAVAKARSVMFMCDSVEILEQTAGTMEWWGIKFGIIHGQHRQRAPWELVHIGTIQTLRNRTLPRKDIVFVDECHLARAASWEKVIQHYIDQGAKVIGASATPCRLDGRGLGKLFKQIVYCPSIEDLTRAGHLVPFRIFAPPPPDLSKVHTSQGDFKKDELAQVMDKAKLIGNAVEHYGELGRGRLAILAATGIEHSRHLAAAFVAAGIPAAHCDGMTRPEERARILKSLPAGEIQVLCQVDICGKGYDCPPVSCVIDCRPTQSLARWLQFVGRGIRPYQGKIDCLLLDHSGNVHRPEFGLPDQPREWTLEETATKRKAEDDEAVVRITTCRQCFASFRPGLAACPHCGAAIVPEERKIIVEDGKLEEVKPRMVCSKCRRDMPGADRGDPCAAEVHGPENWGDFGEMILRSPSDCPGVAQRAYAIANVVRDPEVAALQMVAQEKGHPSGWIWIQLNILAKQRRRPQGWVFAMMKQVHGAGVGARA